MELLKHVSKYHFVEQGEMQNKEEEIQIDHKDLKENIKKCVFVFGDTSLQEREEKRSLGRKGQE